MLENLQINFYPIKNLKEKSNNSTKNVGKSIYGNESTHLLG